MTGLDAAAAGFEFATAATVSVTAGADTDAAVGALTTAADDDARSATLLGADEDAEVEIDTGVMIDADSDESPAEDGEKDDGSDAVDDPAECSTLDPVET